MRIKESVRFALESSSNILFPRISLRYVTAAFDLPTNAAMLVGDTPALSNSAIWYSDGFIFPNVSNTSLSLK